MRIVVSANGAHLDAPVSPQFGRCPYYLFVDTDTLCFDAIENPAANAPAGAGIHAAQFVIEQDVQAVVAGSMGPNSFRVFQAAGLPIYLYHEGLETVREAVDAFREGRLSPPADPRSAERFVPDQGSKQKYQRDTQSLHRQSGSAADENLSRQQEIAALETMASDLRRQLAEMKAQVKRLEGKQ